MSVFDTSEQGEADAPERPVAVASPSRSFPPRQDFWRRGGSGEQEEQPRLLPDLFLLPGFIGASLAVFSTSLLVPYGFTDSYDVLADAQAGTLESIDAHVVASGRPLYALLQHLAFASITNIDGFRYLRLAAAIAVGLLAWLFYLALRRAGMRQPFALTIPLLICATPPYEVYVGWETCAFFPYAAVLAGAALFAADHALKRRLTKPGILAGSAAVALLSLALMIYQPAAMVFWVFAAISLFGRPASLRSTAKRLGAYGLVMALTLAVEYLATLLLPGMMYGTTPSGRAALVQHPLAKALWFIRQPLVDALNLWNLLPHVSIAGLMAVFTLAGLLLFLPGKPVERGGKFLLALALTPLSYLPNLVVQDDSSPYRTQAGLTSLVVLYACFALLGWLAFAFKAKLLKEALRKRQLSTGKLAMRLAAAVLVGGALVGSALAANNVTSYFVVPQAQELSIVAGHLNDAALAQATSIYIIGCTADDSLSPVVRYDEFGLPSCSQFWVPRPMVYLLLRELHPAQAHLPITFVRPGQPINPPPGSLVIDLRTLRLYRLVDGPAGE